VLEDRAVTLKDELPELLEEEVPEALSDSEDVSTGEREGAEYTIVLPLALGDSVVTEPATERLDDAALNVCLAATPRKPRSLSMTPRNAANSACRPAASSSTKKDILPLITATVGA
jgi:hypothetical protein